MATVSDDDDDVQKRLELRTHPHVLQELDRWWHAALASFADAKASSLTVAQYEQVVRRLMKALYDEWDEEDADTARQVAEDDACGCNCLPEELFKDAIFELADQFTSDASASAYAHFLATAFSAVAGSSTSSTFDCDEGLIKFMGVAEAEAKRAPLRLPAKTKAKAENGIHDDDDTADGV
eukprot:3722321-Prymnesium_polylepis.1